LYFISSTLTAGSSFENDVPNCLLKLKSICGFSEAIEETTSEKNNNGKQFMASTVKRNNSQKA